MATINTDSIDTRRSYEAAITFEKTHERIIFSHKAAELCGFKLGDSIEFETQMGLLLFHKALSTKGFPLKNLHAGPGRQQRLVINNVALIRLLRSRFPALKLERYPIRKLVSQLKGATLYEVQLTKRPKQYGKPRAKKQIK